MIDWRQRQIDMAEKEGRELLIPDCTHEQANTAMRQKQVPQVSIWLWATGLWGPPAEPAVRNHWSNQE